MPPFCVIHDCYESKCADQHLRLTADEDSDIAEYRALETAYLIIHQRVSAAAAGPMPVYQKLLHAEQYIEKQVAEWLAEEPTK